MSHRWTISAGWDSQRWGCWLTPIQIKGQVADCFFVFIYKSLSSKISHVVAVKPIFFLNEVVAHSESGWLRLQHWATWFPGIKAVRQNRCWRPCLTQLKWWLPTTAAQAYQACQHKNKTRAEIFSCRQWLQRLSGFQSLCGRSSLQRLWFRRKKDVPPLLILTLHQHLALLWFSGLYAKIEGDKKSKKTVVMKQGFLYFYVWDNIVTVFTMYVSNRWDCTSYTWVYVSTHCLNLVFYGNTGEFSFI